MKVQSDLLQLRDCVMKNCNITAISVATGMHMKMEGNKEQYKLLNVVKTKGQYGWKSVLPFPNLNVHLS